MAEPDSSPHIMQWLKKLRMLDDRKGLLRFGLSMAGVLILGRSWWWLLLPVIVAWLAFRSDFVRRVIKTLPRDLKGGYVLLRTRIELHQCTKADLPVHTMWLQRVAEHPEKEAVVEIETGRRLSYRELNDRMNQYAAYFASLGYRKDDVVALFMENSIDFFALWLGLSKIGVISSWVNSNLKLEPLAHSIRASKAKCVVTSSSLLPVLKKTLSEGLLPADTNIILNDGATEDASIINLSEHLKGASTSEPSPVPGHTFHSVLCYIFTSGTTGNPKPAVIKHFRYYWAAATAASAFGIRPDDRVYVTMPMYHSAAGMLGVGSALSRGTTLVIRKKFSASNFWKDAVEHRITVTQYIGEICRYLLAQKAVPEEKQHGIRAMFGNGLRKEIWSEFVTRFGVKEIGELYGSTEGNSNLVNLDSHEGACGFLPIYPFITVLYPIRLLRVNEEKGAILRDERGLAIPCRPGETGELVGLIKQNGFLRFEGYVNKEDTDKKIYTDIIQKGDKAFASGDILYWDKLGYLYFKDRRGDTFRWKGENVSTTEVEGILQPVKSVVDCTVYGVEVGKQEGRAGMAALHLVPGVNVEELLSEVGGRFSEHLPSYAVPIFVRICREVDKTGKEHCTYKLKKTDLQKAGFDLGNCDGDSVYFWSGGKYSLLTAEMQQKLQSGEYTRI